MKIHGLEKMSLVDYDGKVSATVFTGTCNFRCGFCHNSALVLSAENLGEIPQTEIFDYLTKRKGLLDGVVVTGGEPTLHKDLPQFIERIKNLGYFVKLDTNGTNPNVVKCLNESGLVDYFAMDIKNDLDSYAEIICVPNFDTKNVKKTIEYFLSGKAKYEFRTTLINEFHKKENILKIGNLIKGADHYFLQKFKNSENCIQSHLSAVDEKTALNYKQLLTEYVADTQLRGY